MIGVNIIKMNKEQMVDAIEYYLNSVLFKGPIAVDDVSHANDGWFLIRLVELEKEKEGKDGSN